MCGEYAVVATAEGNSAGSQGRGNAFASSSSGWSQNRSEMRRALIKPDEIIQDTRADEAFVLVRGAKPLRCGRAIYFRRQDMAPLHVATQFYLAGYSQARIAGAAAADKSLRRDS
jgi:type IV secretion system protein VirD4